MITKPRAASGGRSEIRTISPGGMDTVPRDVGRDGLHVSGWAPTDETRHLPVRVPASAVLCGGALARMRPRFGRTTLVALTGLNATNWPLPIWCCGAGATARRGLRRATSTGTPSVPAGLRPSGGCPRHALVRVSARPIAEWCQLTLAPMFAHRRYEDGMSLWDERAARGHDDRIRFRYPDW